MSTILKISNVTKYYGGGSVATKALDGQHISEMKEDALSAFRRDQLGFIFQDYNLLDTLIIGENIVLPLNLRKESLSKTQSELKRVSEALSVAEQLKKFPNELSGGQRQRAACARAIITNPALVLADEPTGALDSKNAKALMQTLSMMNEKLGSTILMVTHDPVAASYASRVLFRKDGKIWNEIMRGTRSRQDMHKEILSVLAALGGDTDVI